MTEIIDHIKKQGMFENCSALLLYLHKNFWKPEIVISAVADIEEEPARPAIAKHSITAFALGFLLGYFAHRATKEVLEEVSEGRGTEEDKQFTYHFVQLQKKLQTAGILPSSLAPYKS